MDVVALPRRQRQHMRRRYWSARRCRHPPTYAEYTAMLVGVHANIYSELYSGERDQSPPSSTDSHNRDGQTKDHRTKRSHD
jgi:hypothetical protein